MKKLRQLIARAKAALAESERRQGDRRKAGRRGSDQFPALSGEELKARLLEVMQ